MTVSLAVIFEHKAEETSRQVRGPKYYNFPLSVWGCSGTIWWLVFGSTDFEFVFLLSEKVTK